MNWLQRLFRQRLSPSAASAMEAESREWMVRCRACGFDRSLWELGGIRWKASRRQRTWTWGRCPTCGKRGWHTIYRRHATALPAEA